MKLRAVAAAALAAGMAFTPSSHAAGPQVVDPPGDANHVNDNAPVVLPADNPANNNPTPVGSDDPSDILSIEWKSLKEGKKKVLTGFTVVMTLKAAPTKAGMLYRATSETPDCGTLWFQYYTTKPSLTPQASLRHTCGGGAAVVVPIPTKVIGTTIGWTFLFKDKNMPKVVKKGTDITGLGGHSREFVDNPQCLPNYLAIPPSPAPDATKCTTNPVQADVTNNVPGPYKVGS